MCAVPARQAVRRTASHASGEGRDEGRTGDEIPNGTSPGRLDQGRARLQRRVSSRRSSGARIHVNLDRAQERLVRCRRRTRQNPPSRPSTGQWKPRSRPKDKGWEHSGSEDISVPSRILGLLRTRHGGKRQETRHDQATGKLKEEKGMQRRKGVRSAWLFEPPAVGRQACPSLSGAAGRHGGRTPQQPDERAPARNPLVQPARPFPITGVCCCPGKLPRK